MFLIIYLSIYIIFLSSDCVDTAVWMHYVDTN